MASSLKSLVQNIKKQADYMAGSSAQLKEISDTSQSTIVQLAETIANISKATGESAANTQAALLASKNAETSAMFGSKKMTDLLEKSVVLSTDIEKSTASMQKLAEHSEEIKNMVTVIKAVADETKLLSFNAAIEAARAGEGGLGFAVVAEEIRKLSDMSTEQAVKIGHRIKVVREDIAGAIETVYKESETMKESSQLTRETNDIFRDIVKSIDETVAQMESVASAAEQVSASSQEAAASSQEQTAAMEEIGAMVSEFAETATTLKESTDKFSI
jgi:methyl-accepting chemotaxis protein